MQWVFNHSSSICPKIKLSWLVGLIMFDSHVDAANQIQIEVSIGRKSGVKGLIKGKSDHYLSNIKVHLHLVTASIQCQRCEDASDTSLIEYN